MERMRHTNRKNTSTVRLNLYVVASTIVRPGKKKMWNEHGQIVEKKKTAATASWRRAPMELVMDPADRQNPKNSCMHAAPTFKTRFGGFMLSTRPCQNPMNPRTPRSLPHLANLPPPGCHSASGIRMH